MLVTDAPDSPRALIRNRTEVLQGIRAMEVPSASKRVTSPRSASD